PARRGDHGGAHRRAPLRAHHLRRAGRRGGGREAALRLVGLMAVAHRAGDLAEHVAALRLVDHHVHGAFSVELDRAAFEAHLNERAPDPIPDGMTQLDSQLGFAIRRWCGPVLDLPPHAPADEYWRRRAELGVPAVTERFLRAAGVSDWLVDTGYGADAILDVDGMAAASGARAHAVVRLESLAEEIAADGVPG